MGVPGLAAQWQAVAGPAALSSMSSAESSMRGKALLPDLKLAAPLRPTKAAGGLFVVAMAGKKKVNAYDAGWSKQWFGAGFFAENTADEEVTIARILEKKKLLSKVEKAGLLSKLEKLGLSLSTIEKLGLLSKAEGLGLLTLAENFATTSPATVASWSLPLFVASVLSIVLIPDTDPNLVIAQNVLAALCLAGGVGLFIGSIFLSGLQED